MISWLAQVSQCGQSGSYRFGDLRHHFGVRKLGDPSHESPINLREIAADSGDHVLYLFLFGRFVIRKLRGV
nr:hypothetical protein CFP56_71231 [Quercus suber]